MAIAAAVTGIGAVSPVGLSAVSTAAALRAGISRATEFYSTLLDTHRGYSKPAIGSRVPLEWLDGGPAVEEWPGHERFGVEPPPPAHLLIEDGVERLVRLAIPALLEAWHRAGRAAAAPESFGLFVGVGETSGSEEGSDLTSALCGAIPGFRPSVVEVIAEGRASGLAALHRALGALAGGRISGAIAGGVDSLLRPGTHERLLGQGVIRDPDFNPQGVTPGEGAAFVVLERPTRATRALAWLESAAIASEETAGTDDPNLAVGLSRALRSARSGATLAAVPLVVCDLNGDRARALEWALASTRALGDLHWDERAPTSGETWHPADCFGDTGAASGALDCIWAVEALRVGYARTRHVLVWGASDGPLRAAAILRGNA